MIMVTTTFSTTNGSTFDSPDDDHSMANNFNVVDAFCMTQLSLKNYRRKLSLEDHLHLALVSISMLFLSSNQYPDEVKPFFMASILLIAAIQPSCLIDNLLTKTINREQAETNFKSLSLKLLTQIREDVECLDYQATTRINRRRYRIHPDFSNRRPDLCITKSCGVKWDASCGFGEVKPAVHGLNHYLVCKDLLRVAMFCKNSLDSQHMEGILGIQIIGRTVKFYVLILPAIGLYVLLDLAEIMIPDNLQNLASLVIETSNIMKALNVFDMRTNDTETLIKRLTPTISKIMFDQVFSTSKHRNRQCPFKLCHD
ncbi:uncharacterized protein RHIMIDRAFT_242629 [Rhizopus microsporus ATCC 52813]|uniref:Uncharacterized protein n=1 Tax=Rhizopus microsporus ATCC 52813 TaxID=1340429 RepID=A0A2G4SF76_RHIZD|nr:uncharacterized protein RHIMIDRAFT_242629 [Rhizopus microsporus ATCC 52813]PHZ07422.1 hypothetical protein RHIMIDRAFT_242629 [Rhizopus microsporus ATCC 52813]